MNKSLFVTVAIFASLIIFGNTQLNAKENGISKINDSDNRGTNHRRRGPLVLNLKGAGPMYEGTVPDIDGDGVDDPAICFDVDLINLRTGRSVGSGTDCLANINPNGDGLQLVGTTYFNTYIGQMVSRGVTTVHPGNPESLGGLTHITGAAPSGGNDIISGTGRFANASGSVRLSGMVDMSQFNGNVGEPISFDCVFVINFD